MRILTILLVVQLVSIQPFAQSKTDSLRKAFVETSSDQKKIIVVAEMAKTLFIGSQYDSLDKYALIMQSLANTLGDKQSLLLASVYETQALARKDSTVYFFKSDSVLKVSNTLKYIPGIAITSLGVGSRLLSFGKYDRARTILLQGYNAIDETESPDWVDVKSDLIRTVSAVYHHQGMYTEALDYALQSSRLAEKSGESFQRLKSYLNLSGLYGELASPQNDLGTGDDRKRYQKQAKKYMKLSYQYSLSNASKMTQGATAFNLGFMYVEDKQRDSAAWYLNEAIRLGKETGFHELLSNAFRAKSQLFTNSFDSAIVYLNLAYAEALQAKNPITALATTLDRARILLEMNKFKEAEALATTALEESRKLNLLNDQRSSYQILYQIYTKQKNYPLALENHLLYVAIKDSMVNEKNFAKIEELKTRYETEIKDAEIKNLEQRSQLQELEIRQKNLLLVTVILIALALAGTAFLFYRQRTLKQQRKALEIENRFLRFQLDPHFISNALVSIQRFTLDNNATQAANYLTKFSRLMRQLLEYSREEWITIEEEIDLLRNYLDIQKLRLKDRFEYEIHVDNNLSISDSRIPPMFAQPFVENAIEHGIGDREKGKIEISFLAKGNQLLLEIQDDGEGISERGVGAGNKSLSTTIIKERIDLLNKSGKAPIRLHIGKPENRTGTRIQLTLPIYS